MATALFVCEKGFLLGTEAKRLIGRVTGRDLETISFTSASPGVLLSAEIIYVDVFDLDVFEPLFGLEHSAKTVIVLPYATPVEPFLAKFKSYLISPVTQDRIRDSEMLLLAT